MTSVSIHNSLREVAQTPELLQHFGICQKTFAFQDLQLPYCEKIIGEDLPGQPVLVVFLHGAGSVGHDNFLQMRIPAEPLIRFLEQQKIGIVSIMISFVLMERKEIQIPMFPVGVEYN